MTRAKEPTSEESPEIRIDLRTINELLEAKQYGQLTQLLHRSELACQQTNDRLCADILAAARQICLACNQCQTERTWHHQAYHETDQHERKLKQYLQAILDQLEDLAGPEAQQQAKLPAHPTTELNLTEPETLKSGERPNLWRRVQSLLGRQPDPQYPEREVSTEFPKELVASSTEAIEAPASPPAEKTEISTIPPSEEAEASPPPSGEQIEAPKTPSLPKEAEAEQNLPALVVYCLGPFRVYQHDRLIVDWNGLKGQSILKYLLMHKGKPIAKDILMDVFWPDVEPGDTRRNLHQAIYSLRQTLQRKQSDLQPILFKKDCYLLNPEIIVWLDFEEFEKHVQAGRRLEAVEQLAEAMAEYSIAEGLYQGDFLEEDLYEDWPSVQREYLWNLYLDIADRLSEYYVQQGQYTAAIALCQKILAKDNCYEDAYRRLMQCYLAQGQRPLAARQYQTCLQVLKEELDLMPSEETVALYRRIAAG
jgi:DNA-binding SARP family transcriptional activator